MKDITSLVLVALAMMAFFFPVCVQGHAPLAAGAYHSMLIDKDLLLWGWGNDFYGQLAQGDNTNKPTPQPVTLAPALAGDPVSVCAGDRFSCVLDSFKNVACSGNDDYGQQGSGVGRTETNVLGIATGLSDVTNLSCGPVQGLATTKTGALMVWGWDGYGQLGTGTSTSEIWEAVVSVLFLAFWLCDRRFSSVYLLRALYNQLSSATFLASLKLSCSIGFKSRCFLLKSSLYTS
jgi:hypothetical protein